MGDAAASDLIDSKRVASECVNTLNHLPILPQFPIPLPPTTPTLFQYLPALSAFPVQHVPHVLISGSGSAITSASAYSSSSTHHTHAARARPLPSLLLVLFFRACPYSTSSLFATFRIQNISDKLASLSATCDKMQRKQRAAKAAPPLPPSPASIPPQAGWTMQRQRQHTYSKCPSLIYAKTLPERR